MTDTFNMPQDTYHDMWDKLEKIKGRGFSHEILDRWLAINYGIVAVSDEADVDYRYPFKILDERKLMLFMLKWSS